MVKLKTLILLTIGLIVITGCDLVPMHMREQARFDPDERTELWADHTTARPVPENTIPYGEKGTHMIDEAFYTGRVDGEYITEFPASLEIDLELLERGQENYDVFCAPCHGRVGNGQGMIVQRGMKQPNSFHLERVRNQPVGYYYEVITNGFGVMYSYASRVPPDDRWAVVAYIRALQRSQNASLEDAPEDVQEELQSR